VSTGNGILEPGQIEGPREEMRALMLPDRGLFRRRAARLRSLAPGHSLGPYLGFLADLSRLRKRTWRGKHGESLWYQEVAAKAICHAFHVPGAAQFVNIFQEKYFHFFKPFLLDRIMERRVQRSRG